MTDMALMRPAFKWLGDTKQWQANALNVKYASTSNAPLSALAAGAGGQVAANALLNLH